MFGYRGMIIQSVDLPILTDGLILVKGNRIFDIGKFQNVIDRNPEVDVSSIMGGENLLILPGFVNTHSHAIQSIFRGAGDELELLDWLNQVILPGEGALTSKDAFHSSIVGYAEMISSGVTCTNDMGSVYHTDQVFKAAEALGIRGRIGKMLMDRNCPDSLRQDAEDALKEANMLADKYPKDGKLQFSYTPRFLPTCTPELMRNASKEAKKRGLMFHTHASENKDEIKIVESEFGSSNIEALQSLGCLGEHSVLAHCVWVNQTDIEILKDTKTNISHNASSNSKLGSGVAPIPKFIEQGIHFGIATDGNPASGSHDFLFEMRLTAYLQTATHINSKAITAKEVFYHATKGGALALNLPNVGELKKGYLADFIVFRLSTPSAFPMYDPYSYLVYSANQRDISEVIIDGDIVYKDSKFKMDLQPSFDHVILNQRNSNWDSNRDR